MPEPPKSKRTERSQNFLKATQVVHTAQKLVQQQQQLDPTTKFANLPAQYQGLHQCLLTVEELVKFASLQGQHPSQVLFLLSQYFAVLKEWISEDMFKARQRIQQELVTKTAELDKLKSLMPLNNNDSRIKQNRVISNNFVSFRVEKLHVHKTFLLLPSVCRQTVLLKLSYAITSRTNKASLYSKGSIAELAR